MIGAPGASERRPPAGIAEYSEAKRTPFAPHREAYSRSERRPPAGIAEYSEAKRTPFVLHREGYS